MWNLRFVFIFSDPRAVQKMSVSSIEAFGAIDKGSLSICIQNRQKLKQAWQIPGTYFLAKTNFDTEIVGSLLCIRNNKFKRVPTLKI